MSNVIDLTKYRERKMAESHEPIDLSDGQTWGHLNEEITKAMSEFVDLWMEMSDREGDKF